MSVVLPERASLPTWWRAFYPCVAICTAPDLKRPVIHILGIHPCGSVEAIAHGTDPAKVEAEARRLSNYLPGSLYVDCRPLELAA